MLTSLRSILRVVCLVLLAGLVLTPFAQIILRGVFNVPMSGAEEMTRYLLICLTFLGSAVVVAEGGQIRMTEVQTLIPPRPRFALQLVVDVAGVAIYAILFLAGAITIANNLSNQTATLEMPFWLFMGPLALGSLLMLVETLLALVRLWRDGRPEDVHTTVV